MPLRFKDMKNTNYVPRLYSFLEELRRRQDREWFKANRSEYDDLRALWLADVDRLLAAIRQWWPSLRPATAKEAAYRIYRDTRFSLDKSPFKNYFSASFGPYGRGTGSAHLPGLYLHMGPGLYEGQVEGASTAASGVPKVPCSKSCAKPSSTTSKSSRKSSPHPTSTNSIPAGTATA